MSSPSPGRPLFEPALQTNDSRKESASMLRMTISMSLDGYIAGPDQSLANPLGEGGEELHRWVVPLEIFRRMHGGEGGEVNASTAVVEEWVDNVGATVMGRNMFGGGPG